MDEIYNFLVITHVKKQNYINTLIKSINVSLCGG